MRYKLLGNSGLRVSEICLGTMTFGEDFAWGSSQEESRRVFDAFVDAGGNFFDTANHYTHGTSERFLGEFIHAERDRFVVATKYTLTQRPDDPNAGGNHRKSMVQALHGSLERLNTDHIDLYWVHARDVFTPVEEMMRALDDVVRAGKVLYVGISDAPAWVVARANTLAELRGWSPFVGLQIQYSLIERTAERELLPMASALDIGVTPWSPLGGGLLTGKYGDGKRQPKDARFTIRPQWGERFLKDRNFEIAKSVTEVADAVERSPSQVALNWLRQNDRGEIIPIVGARTLAQLQDNLSCLDFELSRDQLRTLDDVSAIEPGFPHDFLATEGVQNLVYGEKLELIDIKHGRGRS